MLRPIGKSAKQHDVNLDTMRSAVRAKNLIASRDAIFGRYMMVEDSDVIAWLANEKAHSHAPHVNGRSKKTERKPTP